MPKDFADRFSNILERKMNYEIDARYTENVEMGGSPSEADRSSLENLAKLYQKADLQEHSERITGLIPHDPAAELGALLSSEQSWDIKLKNISSIISSEAEDRTIRKLWKSASTVEKSEIPGLLGCRCGKTVFRLYTGMNLIISANW